MCPFLSPPRIVPYLCFLSSTLPRTPQKGGRERQRYILLLALTPELIRQSLSQATTFKVMSARNHRANVFAQKRLVNTYGSALLAITEQTFSLRNVWKHFRSETFGRSLKCTEQTFSPRHVWSIRTDRLCSQSQSKRILRTFRSETFGNVFAKKRFVVVVFDVNIRSRS